jgi:hypothetical protein
MSKDYNFCKACVLPFSHFNAYPMGDARACTMSGIFKDIDLNKISIDEAFNSEEYKKLRSDMLSGIENDMCKVCYNMESRNSESYRQKANNTYEKEYGITVEDLVVDMKEDGFLKPNFIKLDIRPSNICNFKCRTCSSEYSTRWIEEDKAYAANESFSFNEIKYRAVEKSYGISDDSIINLKEIYIAGGESLYMAEMYKFLEGIKNKSNITLHIHTNLSLLKFKKYDLFELLKDFNTINFFISCDGVGEVGEYIRTGFVWKTFCENVDKLLVLEKQFPHFRHNFHFTSSILNLFHFFEFLEEMKSRNYVETDSQIQFYPVRWPTYFNSVNFNMKSEILEYYRSNFYKISSDELKIQVQNYIDYVSQVEMDQDWNNIKDESGVDSNARHEFQKRIDFGNKFNKTMLPKSVNYL